MLTIDQTIGETGGSQSLTLSGDGELILSGTDTYTGGTIISGGTLDFASGSAVPTGMVTISGNGWLELDGFGIGGSGASLMVLPSGLWVVDGPGVSAPEPPALALLLVAGLADRTHHAPP